VLRPGEIEDDSIPAQWILRGSPISSDYFLSPIIKRHGVVRAGAKARPAAFPSNLEQRSRYDLVGFAEIGFELPKVNARELSKSLREREI
jgi:hypothetical protein